MLLVRSPLRISLGGGGTDLPSYYREFGSAFVSAAIDKYVYVALSQPYEDSIVAKYSKYEKVLKVEEIEHPILRETLRLVCPEIKKLEIASFADIPAGTGLGSSGSFGTALVKVLNLFLHKSMAPKEIAELAIFVESVVLGEPTGKQDQYIAAFGGISQFTISKDGSVEVSPLELSSQTIHLLEANLCLFYTGKSRDASKLLSDQDKRSRQKERVILKDLDEIKSIGAETKIALENANMYKFAELMNEHWQIKRRRTEGMSSNAIDQIYTLALENGALGGKLVGAGGGGFLMFYTEDPPRLRSVMESLKMRELRFGFDFEGTKVVLS
jgi:D-glycero-alpha-D-manno-heptose-7-phosphate kinase